VAESPRDVARDAWRWHKDAEAHWRRSDQNSRDEVQAIQAMALSALCGLYAEELDRNR
jgi:hypothetical protein